MDEVLPKRSAMLALSSVRAASGRDTEKGSKPNEAERVAEI